MIGTRLTAMSMTMFADSHVNSWTHGSDPCRSYYRDQSPLTLDAVTFLPCFQLCYLLYLYIYKLQLLKFIEKDPLITLSFCTCEMYEYPLSPATQKHMWIVKTSTQIEEPAILSWLFKTIEKINANNMLIALIIVASKT